MTQPATLRCRWLWRSAQFRSTARSLETAPCALHSLRMHGLNGIDMSTGRRYTRRRSPISSTQVFGNHRAVAASSPSPSRPQRDCVTRPPRRSRTAPAPRIDAAAAEASRSISNPRIPTSAFTEPATRPPPSTRRVLWSLCVRPGGFPTSALIRQRRGSVIALRPWGFCMRGRRSNLRTSVPLATELRTALAIWRNCTAFLADKTSFSIRHGSLHRSVNLGVAVIWPVTYTAPLVIRIMSLHEQIWTDRG